MNIIEGHGKQLTLFYVIIDAELEANSNVQ